MTALRIDLETYSSVDLKRCGVHRYVESPDFEILLFGFKWGDGQAHVIDLAQGEQLPDHILAALDDPKILKTAYNAAFELACLSRHLGRRLDETQWRCTSVHALYLGLPGNLGDVGKVIGLAPDKQKSSIGWSLIRYFCIPCKPTKKNGERTRNLPHHDLAKWQLFKDYCAQDVESEHAISERLARFQVPDIEWKLWHLDQRMMNLGVLVDRKLVEAAIECDTIFKQRLLTEAIQLTGLGNPNSRNQLLAWLQEEEDDDTITDLTKKTVPKVLEATDSDVVRRVLELRQELAKTSVSKYHAMARAMCSTDTVHGLTRFYGANRTGRWAGQIVQVQNLPQNKLKDLDLARNLLKARDYEALELLFGNVPDTLSQLIRTAFVARPGSRLIPVDFSAIEARVIAWLAWCEWRLEVFQTHGKIYEASAEQMFKLPKGSVTKKSPYRQKGKVAELACFGPDTPVLTSNGTKPIRAVSKQDLVWDGEQWVTHDGVIFQGLRETINLAGIEVTPDHLIRTGRTWKPARQLASNESTLCQALATGLESLPLSAWSGNAEAPATTTWFGCSALAELRRIWSSITTSSKDAALGATLAPRNKRAIGGKTGTPTLRSVLMTSTVGVFSTVFLRPSPVATARTLGSGPTMVAEAYTYTSLGAKTKRLFSPTCLPYLVGMSRLMTWIGGMSTRGMGLETSGSCPGEKTEAPTSGQFESCSGASPNSRPVFDLLNTGPRNRFTVVTARGPILVHNCGYQGGVGALKNMGALEMGLAEEELQPIIKDWREANPEIVDLWYSCERAAKDAVRNKTSVVLPVAAGRAKVAFIYESGFLFIQLPSGRRLAYVKPRIEAEDLYRETSAGGRYVVASAGSLTYEGLDQKTKQWTRLATYGGKLVENITQAVARDCLRESMLALDAEDFPQLFTVHDEIVLEAHLASAHTLEQAEEIMGRPIPWAPGLPLRGDGFETRYYMKEQD